MADNQHLHRVADDVIGLDDAFNRREGIDLLQRGWRLRVEFGALDLGRVGFSFEFGISHALLGWMEGFVVEGQFLIAQIPVDFKIEMTPR
ncbi:hypothetical protein CC1G_04110 [Coprinopsis cinerea okayama7|uniref:Uncharacterized protein n=1 Tax=Coprinopsis cinerea (strain Okayama-7 / 130 / ATCC MYA-4618 / FGSC 9003) TaxID=240176 RepID=A8NW08_COPC7|nr:hypothetical protein CC1G_04110 [Coprinopsis cinerea okayama7\|eukprot:XP_001836797.1 hypothetical protein CC1G_04110 [Coprinopsis cinerea okayama7\